MPKKRVIALVLLIVLIIIIVPIMSTIIKSRSKADINDEEMLNITIWQIDGFEGGINSRAAYLKKCGKELFDGQRTYVNVISLSAESARENISSGRLPDMVSYNAGFYGIEDKINDKDFAYVNWCYGSYCFLTLDKNADFCDLNDKNTLINIGKDNLATAAALFAGIEEAETDTPTNAYLKLIGGKYKYLLGTQRDIFRLKTRGAEFAVKPIEEFNDLYQNISIITGEKARYEKCLKFVKYLSGEEMSVDKIGLMKINRSAEIDELTVFNKCTYEYKLNFPASEQFILEIKQATKNKDINKLKKLLK